MTIEVFEWSKPIELTSKHKEIAQRFCCSECSHKHSHEDLMDASLIYGIFFLVGDDDFYIGTNCSNEDCQKSFVINQKIENLEYAYELISYYISQFTWKIRDYPKYFLSVNFSPRQHLDLIDFDIHTYQSQFSECSDIEGKEYELEIYIKDHPQLSEHYYSSYVFKSTQPLGKFTVWWFNKKDIKKLVTFENDKKIRIFPRYIPNISLYEEIDRFCWHYQLSRAYLLEFADKNEKNINAQKEDAQNKDKTLEEIIKSDSYLIPPDQVKRVLQQPKITYKDKFDRVSNFFGILSIGVKNEYLPTEIRRVNRLKGIEAFTHKVNPFEVPEIYEVPHQKMIDEILPQIHIDFVQKKIIKKSGNFIQDYIQLFLKQGFNYQKAWELKEKYLYQIYSDKSIFESKLTKKPKLRPDQLHRLACIEVAIKIWKKHPDMTIAAMIDRREIIDACEGKKYGKNIVRNWVRGECPNPRQGRPPKKKK